jgi:hypothetical protein
MGQINVQLPTQTSKEGLMWSAELPDPRFKIWDKVAGNDCGP